MINLNTSCGKSDTLLAALLLALCVTPAGSYAQVEEASETKSRTEPVVSVLESSDEATRKTSGWDLELQDDPFGPDQDSILPNVGAANELARDQLPIVPQPTTDAVELEEPQVLLRGPLHEAFADAYQADPTPNPVVNADPPEAIQEVPPEFKPEGSHVEWIPGYWAWDVAQNDFIWISGVWRDVPPNKRWVPGYWERVENGHRWVAGFWADLDQQELNYLPTPPASLDQGPSIAAPSDDYFYCPGNWVYQNNTYVWRTGHWQPRVSNWIWIPARYIWTPRGCIYRPGYWDFEFDVRGVVFAPVRFRNHHYRANDFYFQPNHCVNTGANFFVHFFVRPNCNHYFFGNWYGQSFVSTGFRPWIHPRSHRRNYDPLLAHYNCSRYRQGNQLLINWVNVQHQHYHRNRNHRPRNTLQAHAKFSKSARDLRHYDFIKRANLTNRYDDVVRLRGKSLATHSRNARNQRSDNPNLRKTYVRTDRRDSNQQRLNELVQREIKKTRKSNEKNTNDSRRDSVRLVQDKPRRKPENGKGTPGKQNSNAPKRSNIGTGDGVPRNKMVLPKTQVAKTPVRNDRGNANGLTQAQTAKAKRDREKAIRMRELEQKIAAAKQQAEIKRQQRATARETSHRQSQHELAQAQQKIEREKQVRQPSGNQNTLQSKKRAADPRFRSNGSQKKQKSLEEPQRQQAQRQSTSSRAGSSKVKQASAQNMKIQAARQKADLAQRQLDAQKRLAKARAKQTVASQATQSREFSAQRDMQRQREKAAAAQKRTELQARIASEKSQREAQRRAAQQRAQQKVQAEAQRRAREKSQRDAQRNAVAQARRVADAARKRQRQQEQAARRAKRKKN